MAKRLRLSEKFINKLTNLPESGMGFHKVKVHLKSGQVLRNKVVLNSEFLVVEDSEEFSTKDILKIQLE